MLARHDSIPFPYGRGQDQPVWARGRTRSSAVAAWMVLSCATGDLSTPTTTRGHFTPGATWSSELPVDVPGTSKPSQGALHTPPRPRALTMGKNGPKLKCAPELHQGLIALGSRVTGTSCSASKGQTRRLYNAVTLSQGQVGAGQLHHSPTTTSWSQLGLEAGARAKSVRLRCKVLSQARLPLDTGSLQVDASAW
jgi:hypothetical protein